MSVTFVTRMPVATSIDAVVVCGQEGPVAVSVSEVLMETPKVNKLTVSVALTQLAPTIGLEELEAVYPYRNAPRDQNEMVVELVDEASTNEYTNGTDGCVEVKLE